MSYRDEFNCDLYSLREALKIPLRLSSLYYNATLVSSSFDSSQVISVIITYLATEFLLGDKLVKIRTRM